MINDAILKELSNIYIDVVKDIAKNQKLENKQILISQKALSNALAEFAKDVEIMQKRRNKRDFSPAKYAGIITFRLSRWNILHINNDEKDFSVYPYLVALSVAFKYFLHIDIAKVDKEIRKELIYVFARRHTNQEMLGICYDILHKYIKWVVLKNIFTSFKNLVIFYIIFFKKLSKTLSISFSDFSWRL